MIYEFGRFQGYSFWYFYLNHLLYTCSELERKDTWFSSELSLTTNFYLRDKRQRLPLNQNYYRSIAYAFYTLLMTYCQRRRC